MPAVQILSIFANDLPALKTRLTQYLLRTAESLLDKATRDIQVSIARDALQQIRAATAVKRLQRLAGVRKLVEGEIRGQWTSLKSIRSGTEPIVHKKSLHQIEFTEQICRYQ